MKKKIFWLFMILLLAGAVIGYYFFRESRQDRSHLTLYGNVDIRQVTLGFRVPGRILKMLVDEGDAIKTGQVLAELDPVPYQNALAKAKGELAQAEANLLRLRNGYRPEEIEQGEALVKNMLASQKNAIAQHERNAFLVPTRAVSEKEFDITLAKKDEAAAQVELAKAHLTLLKSGYRNEEIRQAEAMVATAKAMVDSNAYDLQDTTLKAPNDGIVQTRIQEPGAIVNAGSGLYTLTLNSPVWVRAYVPEPDLGKIYPGMAAQIYTDSQTGVAATGKIGFISPVAEFTPKSVETATLRTDLVYRLRIIVDNPDGRLRQGMPVTVKIKLDR